MSDNNETHLSAASAAKQLELTALALAFARAFKSEENSQEILDLRAEMLRHAEEYAREKRKMEFLHGR